MTRDLSIELTSFAKLWNGGFATGYKEKRNQRGLEHYLKHGMTGTTCLEIGCGRGQWSKYIYEQNIFDMIYCVDVVPESHSQFWSHVGEDKRDKIQYIQLNDFKLSEIQDNSLDYVFSYDVFCHISFTGQQEYLKNLYNKCKKSCVLNIMYADARKYLNSEPEHIEFVREYLPNKASHSQDPATLIESALADKDGPHSPGRWYWVGIENFTDMVLDHGFKILCEDLDVDKTNPITLFIK